MRPTSVGHITYCLKKIWKELGRKAKYLQFLLISSSIQTILIWHFDTLTNLMQVSKYCSPTFSHPSPPFSPLSLSLTNSPHPLPTIFSAETKTNLIWYGIPLNKMKLSTPGVALPKLKYGFQNDQYSNIQKRHITSGWKIVWDLKWVYLKFDSKSWEVKVCIRRGWWD